MSILKSIFGSKVKVPEFKEIDPDVEVQKLLTAYRSSYLKRNGSHET